MEKSYRERGDVLAMKGGREEVERRVSVISVGSEKQRRMMMDA